MGLAKGDRAIGDWVGLALFPFQRNKLGAGWSANDGALTFLNGMRKPRMLIG